MIEFTNREAALIIWALVMIGAVLITPQFQASAWGLIRTFLRAYIILIFLALGTVWVLASVWWLYAVGIWQWENLKVTLLWYVTFALVTMFKGGQIIQNDEFFRRAVLGIITFTTILTFIAETYSFNFWVEMALVPFLAVVTLMNEIAKDKPEFAASQKVFNSLLVLTGLTFIGYSVYQVLENWNDFISIETVREFFIPAILSALFLPFLYSFAVYEAYVNLPIVQSRYYAITKSLWEFRFRLSLIRRWTRHVRHRYVRFDCKIPISKQEINNSIKGTQKLIYNEKYPPIVEPELGWSPNIARTLLANVGIAAREYTHIDEETWWAGSNSLLIGEGVLPHKIDYYIEGSETAVTSLKLSLHINFPEAQKGESVAAEEKFSLLCQYLFELATKHQTPSHIVKKLNKGHDFSIRLQHYKVSSKKEVFVNEKHGYWREFVVCIGAGKPN